MVKKVLARRQIPYQMMRVQIKAPDPAMTDLSLSLALRNCHSEQPAFPAPTDGVRIALMLTCVKRTDRTAAGQRIHTPLAALIAALSVPPPASSDVYFY